MASFKKGDRVIVVGGEFSDECGTVAESYVKEDNSDGGGWFGGGKEVLSVNDGDEYFVCVEGVKSFYPEKIHKSYLRHA